MAARTPSYSAPMIASGSRVIVVVSDGKSPTPPPGFVNVPDVAGMKQGDALAALQGVGSSAQVFNDYSDIVRRGMVMGQLPSTGAGMPGGTEALLLVSSGPAAGETAVVMLPEVLGKSEADASNALQAVGLSPQVVRQYSSSTPAGIVTAQLPNRSSLAIAAEKGGVKPWMWAAGVAALIVLALIVFFMTRPSAETVKVPGVVGMTQTEAVAAVEAAGLVAEVTEVEGAAAAGSVETQDPAKDTEVAKGSSVKIGVVKPAADIAVPDVRGLTQADATKMLADAGLKVTSTQADSDSVDQGLVIEQAPLAGRAVPAGSTVAVVISNGSGNTNTNTNVSVPDVEGMTRSSAEKAFSDAGLKVFVAENPSTTVAKDVVISQLPAAGDSVAPGTSVGIQVSSGPPADPNLVNTPSVVGMPLADAQKVMSDAGLKSLPVPSTGSGKPANQVLAQTPAGDSQTAKGSEVVLFYAAP